MGKIADLIGSAYENWYGETVFLDCGEVGEVREFVLEYVFPMAAATGKEILYLSDAQDMQKQKEEMARADADKALRVMSYAEFEQMVQYHVAFDGQYDYIFAENCRALLESRREAEYSALVLDFLLQAQRSAVVYIGANAKGLKEFLLRSGKLKKENLFLLPRQWEKLCKLVFVQKQRGKLTGARLVQEIMRTHPGEGILYFCASKEKMRGTAQMLSLKEMPKKENAPMFGVSGEVFGNADGSVIAQDARVPLEKSDSYARRHVILDFFDVDLMIGCLDEMEKTEGTYCLYIVEYNGTQLRYLYGIYAGQMHNLSLFRQMERGEGGEFLRRSQEPRFLTDNPMFFVQQADEYGGCRFQINSRQRILCEAELASLETIQKMGYRKWILQALGKPACAQEERKLAKVAIGRVEWEKIVQELERIKNQKLAGAELERFRAYLCGRFSRKTISVSMANLLMEQYALPYFVESKKERARTSPHYNHYFWTVSEKLRQEEGMEKGTDAQNG